MSYDVGGRTWLQLNISNLTDEYVGGGIAAVATPRAARFTVGHRSDLVGRRSRGAAADDKDG
jgi:hypothetical protein